MWIVRLINGRNKRNLHHRMNWKNLGLLFQRAKKAILESGRNSSQTQGRENHKWRESICLLVLCIVPTEGSSSWKLWFMLSFKEAVHIVWEAMFTCSVYCANWRIQFVEAVFYVEFKEAVHIVWEAMFTCSVYCANWRLQFVEAVIYVEFQRSRSYRLRSYVYLFCVLHQGPCSWVSRIYRSRSCVSFHLILSC